MNETTRPSGLAERIKGKAKRFVGTLTGDDDLRHEGELHERKAAEITEAAVLEAEATQRATEADLREREQQLATATDTLATESLVDAEAEAIAQQRREQGARIGADAARREAAVEAKLRAQEQAASAAAAEALREHAAKVEIAETVEQAAETARAEAERLDAAARAEEN